ncbi:MAG TPA: bifunctional diaminohydroxyphosphoribosylaminopyrimidine deaminase/5-amino-6-(5-phosphoribosylamino)uracil reductase RibD [Thermoanaerobaculia bacterium]
MPSSAEAGWLRQALRLAARGRYRAAPNPMVGAVVVAAGEVVGSGWHRQVGGPHAEVEALAAAGERARGATLYVTLEPCAHHGRTPPCADAVVAAGIARVVACHGDPDPRVAGRGFARLRAAGIEVEVGLLAAAAVRLNLRYLVAATERRPQVTLKWAMSLDGRIATAGGESQWISSPPARRWALALREEHDAILVGSGTVLADDPRLDRRLGLAGKPGLRAVLDRRLRLAAWAAAAPPGAPRRLFTVADPLLIYTSAVTIAAAGVAGQLPDLPGKVEVVALPVVEPAAVLADLHARGVHSVLVEGGAEVLASFAASGLCDRVAAVCAPLLIGGRDAPGPLGGAGAASLAEAERLDHLQVQQRGGDLIVEAVRKGLLEQLLARLRGDHPATTSKTRSS